MRHGVDWYKREPAAYLGGVQGMSAREHAVYSVVLDLIYVHGGTVNNDPRWIAGWISDMGAAAVRATIAALVERGKLAVEGEFLTQKRAKTEAKTKENLRENPEKTEGKRGKNATFSDSKSSENNDLGSGDDAPRLDKTREEKNKEEEDAQARGFDSDFFKSLRDALGVQDPTAYWSDPSMQPHVDAWRAGGLTDEAILSAAKASRDKNPSPPDGPKALDRWMEQAARAGQKPKPAAAPTKATEAEMLTFWAERINGTGFVAPSSITPITARRLVEAGLVQPETLKRRGIAA